MREHKINKNVKALLSEVLIAKNLSLDASQENTPEWDSIAYLTIIARLEKEFKLKITQNNINNFGSVRNIIKEIELCKHIKL